jgi:hypothetical protein
MDGGFANNTHRGIASLYFNGQTLRFRTNPNEIWWSYTLNTNVEQTYGGRVVQILGTRIEDLVIKIECGNGGWAYLTKVVDFLRNMMLEQRKNGGKTAVFSYTTRRWRMKVYALSVPFQDQVTATTRELEIRFKVVEDLTGQMTQMALSNELARLTDGIGFRKSKYNDPKLNTGFGNEVTEATAGVSFSDIPNNLSPALGALQGNITSLIPTIPGLAAP